MLRGGVLLVSENAFIRRGLAQAVAKDTLTVAAEVGTVQEALSVLKSGNVHTDVIAVDMDSCGDVAGLSEVASYAPHVGIVMIASNADRATYERALCVQAKALIPSSVSADALNLTLQLAILGENLFLSTGDAPAEVRPTPQSRDFDVVVLRLSPREAQILGFIRGGATNKVIARLLNVADATVKAHVKSVLRKLDVENRTQAAIWAINHLEASESPQILSANGASTFNPIAATTPSPVPLSLVPRGLSRRAIRPMRRPTG